MTCVHSSGVRLPGASFGIRSLTNANRSESVRPAQEFANTGPVCDAAV